MIVGTVNVRKPCGLSSGYLSISDWNSREFLVDKGALFYVRGSTGDFYTHDGINSKGVRDS